MNNKLIEELKGLVNDNAEHKTYDNMKNTPWLNQLDIVSEAVGLGKLSDMLGPKEEPCEFCTHDSPCRMHYNDQLKANVGSVEYNKPAKGNF